MEMIVVFEGILVPILVIGAFIIGFNINAPKKIGPKKKVKREKTDDELLLERIENARV